MRLDCAHDGCRRSATHAPKICVPATGYPQEESRALVLLLDIALCREHAEAFDPSDELDQPTPNGEGSFGEVALPIVARMSGSTVPPDTSRAWTVAVRLNDDQMVKLREIQARGSTH